MPQKMTVACRCLVQRLSSPNPPLQTFVLLLLPHHLVHPPLSLCERHQFTYKDDPLHQKQATVSCLKKDQMTNTLGFTNHIVSAL